MTQWQNNQYRQDTFAFRISKGCSSDGVRQCQYRSNSGSRWRHHSRSSHHGKQDGKRVRNLLGWEGMYRKWNYAENTRKPNWTRCVVETCILNLHFLHMYITISRDCIIHILKIGTDETCIYAMFLIITCFILLRKGNSIFLIFEHFSVMVSPTWHWSSLASWKKHL